MISRAKFRMKVLGQGLLVKNRHFNGDVFLSAKIKDSSLMLPRKDLRNMTARNTMLGVPKAFHAL